MKVLGLERSFISRYEPSAGTFATSMAALQVMSGLPRYVIETLAFGTVMALFLYLLASEGGVQAVLPTIGAFALAGYRLLPALQQVYISSTTLRFNQSVLDTMHRDLMASARPEGESHRDTPSTDITLPVRPAARLPFRRELRLDQVTYTYPGAEVPALREVSLVIPRKSSVAFIGATGSGKSTLVDIILGLLQPQSGSILVDGTEINENNLSAWQANIGYVPQDIYLTDDTITANIAFGVPHDQIDYKALERAARIANIHDFISAELPDKYETVVGERGIRMSGGQKQRIGIARALYHDPAVLVLDEATSSLDSETERCIVESLEEVRGDRTLIVITHRLSTVRRSDRLYQVVRGCLTEA